LKGEPHYEVEEIIDSNWYYGHLQYKIKYKGYGKEHDEWQFRDDLLGGPWRRELEGTMSRASTRRSQRPPR
jgi:hypothetical protein